MKNEQWKKVATHPGSLKALQNLMEVLMKSGMCEALCGLVL